MTAKKLHKLLGHVSASISKLSRAVTGETDLPGEMQIEIHTSLRPQIQALSKLSGKFHRAKGGRARFPGATKDAKALGVRRSQLYNVLAGLNNGPVSQKILAKYNALKAKQANEPKTFAQKVHERLAEKGMSIKQLAETIGCKPQIITYALHYYRGRTGTRVRGEICRLLDLEDSKP